MTESNYSIAQICQLCGLPRRTIHFYTQQHILPPPIGLGAGAKYEERHLMRLRAIPIFRRQGKKLDQMRALFAQFSDEEISDFVTNNQPGKSDISRSDMKKVFSHYDLPGGLTLMVPPDLSTQGRKILESILNLITNSTDNI
jgi:DNA-binding transcriptional MerR regulator